MKIASEIEALAIHFERRALSAKKDRQAPLWHWDAGVEANQLDKLFYRADQLYGRMIGVVPPIGPVGRLP